MTIRTLYDDPDLYDGLQTTSAAQLNYYLNIARQCAGSVLELGCGSGQLLVPLASLGFPATGLDRSAPMLLAAARRATGAKVTVQLIEGDMRDFELGQKFSLIFVARNSLLHLSEPADFAGFFASVRRHLKPDGILAFDIFSTNLQLLSRPAGQRFQVMKKTLPGYGEVTVEAMNDYDVCSQVNRATWFISTAQERDAWVVPLHLRSIFPQELRVLLALNGVRLVRRDGDFSGGDYTSSSVSQVCQCRFD